MVLAGGMQAVQQCTASCSLGLKLNEDEFNISNQQGY